MARASGTRLCAELVHLAREAGDAAAARAALLEICRRLVAYDRAVLTEIEGHGSLTSVERSFQGLERGRGQRGWPADRDAVIADMNGSAVFLACCPRWKRRRSRRPVERV